LLTPGVFGLRWTEAGGDYITDSKGPVLAPLSCSCSTPLICASLNRLFPIVDLCGAAPVSSGQVA
jgi:hypothetical protein